MNNLEKYLAEVRERCDKATEGPFAGYDKSKPFTLYTLDRKIKIADFLNMEDKPKENLFFLAHARTDVPKLLKMVALMDQIIKYTCMNVPESKEWLGEYKETLDIIARGEDER